MNYIKSNDREPQIHYNYNNKIELRRSDFSIDHLLNRAGTTCTNLENCTICPKISSNQIILDVPYFSWLQNTRYHPPKLPRAFGHVPAKRTPGRLPRIPFTGYQLSTLEDAYNIATYITSDGASKLAETLNLTISRVKIWFQNRRARERRIHKVIHHAEGEYSEDNSNKTNE